MVLTPNFTSDFKCLSSSIGSSHVTNSWIIDFGETNHIVCSFSYLTCITHCISGSVKLPNELSVPITHVGEVRFSTSLLLIGVLCVPSFGFNLISASKITYTSSCCFIFLADHCFFQNLTTWRTIGMGELRSGLYYWLPISSAHLSSVVSCFNVNKIDVNFQHLRLGHLSII